MEAEDPLGYPVHFFSILPLLYHRRLEPHLDQLQYKYIRSVDERDWETSVEVFHQDGKLYLLDRAKKRVFGDKNEIEAFYKGIASKDFIFSRLFIIDPVVKMDGTKLFSYLIIMLHTCTTLLHGSFSDLNMTK